jgi:uncharacterized protein (TIGR03000 family)
MGPLLRKIAPLMLLALPAGFLAGCGGGARADSPDTAPAQAATPAHVTVRVPPDAELWFEGLKMTLAGSVRRFQSPPLTLGRLYAYEVRARWLVDGREDSLTRTILVSAGDSVEMDFPSAAGPRGNASGEGPRG